MRAKVDKREDSTMRGTAEWRLEEVRQMLRVADLHLEWVSQQLADAHHQLDGERIPRRDTNSFPLSLTSRIGMLRDKLAEE